MKESVWDYPRPPRLEAVTDRLRVVHCGETIADTLRGWRVLETSHPPTYYFPAEDVAADRLVPASGSSYCEWKGAASYFHVEAAGQRAERVAWSYPNPTPAFAALRNAVAFYASRMDECWVGEERVLAQAGDFYGGWVTARIVGPFKGGAGTAGW